MSRDASHTLYLTKKQTEEYEHWQLERGAIGYVDPDKFVNDLGMPVFHKAKKENDK
jgi:hypothetical protein